MIVNVPGISIWRNFSFRLAFTGCAAGGVVKEKKMMAALTPPTGRFI
jgi:hypothetical protein